MVEAAREGRVEEAKVMWSVLSELGADIDGADEKGRTAVWMAAMSGEVEVVRMLRELGSKGETPPSKVRGVDMEFGLWHA